MRQLKVTVSAQVCDPKAERALRAYPDFCGEYPAGIPYIYSRDLPEGDADIVFLITDCPDRVPKEAATDPRYSVVGWGLQSGCRDCILDWSSSTCFFLYSRYISEQKKACPLFRGEGFYLRELFPEDAEGVWQAAGGGDPREELKKMGFLCENKQELYAALSGYRDRVYRVFGLGLWGIFGAENHEFLGRVGVAPNENTSGELSMGWYVAPGARGRGLALRAAETCIDLMDWLDVTSFTVQADARNIPSVKTLLALRGRLAGKMYMENADTPSLLTGRFRCL